MVVIMENQEKSLYSATFGKKTDSFTPSVELTESNFKHVYPELFINKTSRSRRERLFGGRKIITKNRRVKHFDESSYISAANVLSERTIDVRYSSAIYRNIKSLCKKLLGKLTISSTAIGRDVSILLSSSLFDPEWYGNLYSLEGEPDKLAEHYLLVGYSLLYDPSPNFSTKDYLLNYQDVTFTSINPLLHYLTLGISENRKAFKSRLTKKSGEK